MATSSDALLDKVCQYARPMTRTLDVARQGGQTAWIGCLVSWFICLFFFCLDF